MGPPGLVSERISVPPMQGRGCDRSAVTVQTRAEIIQMLLRQKRRDRSERGGLGGRGHAQKKELGGPQTLYL